MRPDPIMVEEVMNVTVIDMLQAINTGQNGSMSIDYVNTAMDTSIL
ncbi:MAG: hypothetical protein ACFWTJ_15335 [Lachnoclostridium sp.]|jgi:Flp pilus assembly CpaF family ATPase